MKPRAFVCVVTSLFSACGSDADPSSSPASSPRGGASPVQILGTTSSQGALDAAESAAAYEASCVTTTSEAGTTRTCDYQGTTCVELYDATGDFLSWDCGALGRYSCTSSDAGRACNYDDGNGATCSEVYSADWSFISSDCTDGDASQRCAQSEGGFHCIYEDADYFCEYTYDADFVLRQASCDSSAGSYNCAGDATRLSCAYAYSGYETCAETYVNDESYGLLASDCDWDVDGDVDCTAVAGSGLRCEYSDGAWSCIYEYDSAGTLTAYACEGP